MTSPDRFAPIKGELLDLHAWPTKAAAKRTIFDSIGCYNGTRLHGTPRWLGCAALTPRATSARPRR